ncbi:MULTISPECIES: hypothetical protein [unclassified Desulfovibrio]|uniref:hypothetical protein n=1 Tax=unclassified Desulfovibrio TaxID=2593640 RepID=UPI002FD9527A
MLTTKNREWGFFGTARQQCGEAFAERAWRVAFEHVQNWMGWNDEMTRDFLDSKCGRFYADEMCGKKNWQRALTHYSHLEHDCRRFFEAERPLAYKTWCAINGKSQTERTLRHTGISKADIHKAVSTLLGLDYTASQIEDMVRKAGPLAQALAMILADIPEEIRDMYMDDKAIAE